MLPQNLVNRLIANGIVVLLGVIAFIVIRRTRVDPSKRVDVSAFRHQAEATAGVIVVGVGIFVVLLIFDVVLATRAWWLVLVAIPLAGWAAWWLPGSRRLVVSEASITVRGLPARVSAFVSDLPGHAKWSPGTVSLTPELAGPRGPRYRAVERLPSGQEVQAVYVVARDEPGVEVDIAMEAHGASGDYYTFAAQRGGTLVTKRTVVELPYLLALAGGKWMVRGTAGGAQQRRISEVQALKAAFEAGQAAEG